MSNGSRHKPGQPMQGSYLGGTGDAVASLTDLEFRRPRSLTVQDQQQFLTDQ